MALNNLNNPYSPQPSTPVATAPEDHFLGPSSGANTLGGGSQLLCSGGSGGLEDNLPGSGPQSVAIQRGGRGPNSTVGLGNDGSLENSSGGTSLLHQTLFGPPHIRSRHSSAESEPALTSNIRMSLYDAPSGTMTSHGAAVEVAGGLHHVAIGPESGRFVSCAVYCTKTFFAYFP